MTGERFRNGHRPDSTDASIRGGLKPRSSPLRKGTRMGSEEEEQSRPKSAMGIFETETDQHRCLSVMVYHSTRDGRENFAFGSPCQPTSAVRGVRGCERKTRPGEAMHAPSRTMSRRQTFVPFEATSAVRIMVCGHWAPHQKPIPFECRVECMADSDLIATLEEPNELGPWFGRSRFSQPK